MSEPVAVMVREPRYHCACYFCNTELAHSTAGKHVFALIIGINEVGSSFFFSSLSDVSVVPVSDDPLPIGMFERRRFHAPILIVISGCARL